MLSSMGRRQFVSNKCISHAGIGPLLYFASIVQHYMASSIFLPVGMALPPGRTFSYSTNRLRIMPGLLLALQIILSWALLHKIYCMDLFAVTRHSRLIAACMLRTSQSS